MLKESIQYRCFAIVFGAVITVISIMSCWKLMKFYVQDETDYNEWNASTDSVLETDFISNFWLKYQYVNINGLFENIMGHHVMNNVTKLNNGYLTTDLGDISPDDLAKCAELTGKFSEKVNKQGIQYIYVTVPYTVDMYDTQLPTGIKDSGNEKLDLVKDMMEAQGIESLDLREILHEDGFETYDWFYRTDHHWTTEGGFYAFTKIIDYLEETNDFDVDDRITDFNNYTVTTYKNWHLGSRGQRVGIYYAGIDDFDLILPDFDTDIYTWDQSSHGTLQEMMIDMEPLENKVYTSRYTYDNVYGGSCNNWYNPDIIISLYYGTNVGDIEHYKFGL